MKTLLLICMALVCAITTHAQEVRLDSLWAKFGGVRSLSFSPDSKRLLIGDNTDNLRLVTVYEAATGRMIDTIARTYFYDVSYTPDGRYILMDSDGEFVKLYNAETFKLEKKIACIYGGYIAFSPDGTKVVFGGTKYIAIVDLASEVFLKVITRPADYKISPNQTAPYFNGKVCFSADGKYIIGKYANILVRWDWQNAPDKPEELIPSFPNRAILGFSPDRKYLVQQSNYLWDIAEKKQVSVEGIGDYESQTAYGFAATIGGSCMVVTGKTDHAPRFINMPAKRTFSISPLRYALLMAVSPDSTYFAYQYGNGQSHMYKIYWNVSGVIEQKEDMPIIIRVQPQPGKNDLQAAIVSATDISFCTIDIINSSGFLVAELYRGTLQTGSQVFDLRTNTLPSGNYIIRARYGKNEVSQRFVITK